MLELCFDESVGGLLVCWGHEKEKILCLGDDLSIGPVAGGPESEKRRVQFTRILGSDPWGELPAGDWIGEAWQSYSRTWERLRTLPEGTEVRVWLDQTPGSRCGFLASAGALAHSHARVTAALLPEWVAHPDGTTVTYSGWGEAGPEELPALLETCCREVPAVLLGGLAHRWMRLEEENAPLRAVVNGRLHSVPADFYDGMLLSRLPQAGRSIRLAELIGRTLGECQPGIGDWWLVRRAEILAGEGKFRLERDPVQFYNSLVTIL